MKSYELLGCFVKPDGWDIGSTLEKSDGYSDNEFPGCEYRLPSSRLMDYKLAVNIKVTGRKSHTIDPTYPPKYKTRVRIEFVGDGEPSTFTTGWVYTNDPIEAYIEG